MKSLNVFQMPLNLQDLASRGQVSCLKATHEKYVSSKMTGATYVTPNQKVQALNQVSLSHANMKHTLNESICIQQGERR